VCTSGQTGCLRCARLLEPWGSRGCLPVPGSTQGHGHGSPIPGVGQAARHPGAAGEGIGKSCWKPAPAQGNKAPGTALGPSDAQGSSLGRKIISVQLT